jgi:hypothetical protein
MTLGQALELLQAIRLAQQTMPQAPPPPVLFSFCLAHNARILQPLAEAYDTAVAEGTDSNLVRAHETRRIALLNQAAVRDGNGGPLVVNNQYVLKDPAVAMKRIDKTLAAEFPAAAAMLVARAERRKALGAEKLTAALHKLPLAKWPDLPAPLLDALFALIEDDTAIAA